MMQPQGKLILYQILGRIQSQLAVWDCVTRANYTSDKFLSN